MTESTRNLMRVMTLIIAAMALASLAAAGLPQPGIVLYGQVKNGAEVLTQGTLEWTYTPTQGGAAVKVQTSLQELPGPNNEVYSYSILIPTELRLQGYGNNPKALGIYNDRQTQFMRSATLDGEPLSINASSLGETFSLNAVNHLGYVERVDLLAAGLGDCCPGDADHNLFVNIDDYRAVRDAFGDASPETGDANCDGFVNMKDYAAVRDNFGKQCAPALSSGAAIESDNAAQPEGATPDAAVISARGSSAFAMKGEAVDITVTVEPGSFQIGLIGVFLKYDNTKLRYVAGDLNRETFTSPVFTGVPQEVAPGLIAFSVGSEAGVSVPAKVGSLLFEAIGEGDAGVTLTVQTPARTQALDLSLNPVTTRVSGHELTIGLADSGPASVNDFMLY